MSRLPEASTDAEIRAERAAEEHGDFASLHEAYAVLAEEVDELWAIVKLKREARDQDSIREEAIDVAAVALRIAAQFGGDALEEP